MKDEVQRKPNTIWHILIISIVYFAAHWFLIVATGVWGDDWAYVDRNWSFLIDVMLQSSSPLDAYLAASTWLFPYGVYRVFVFLWYGVSAILFYGILRKIDCIPAQDCMWITMIYIVIPVNDARIQWINHNYAVGLTMFLLGSYIAVSYRRKQHRSILGRTSSLFFLLLGYTFLQSTMILAIPLILVMVYIDLGNRVKLTDWKRNIKAVTLSILSYSDYLFEPVVLYFGTRILFPGYGAHAGVYYVKWSDLPVIVLKSPFYFYKTIRGILASFDDIFESLLVVKIVIITVLFIYLAVLIVVRTKWTNGTNTYLKSDISTARKVVMIIAGALICYLSYLPYIIKIGTACVLDNTYAGGRHTILLGIGVSIMIYYIAALIFNKYASKAFVLIVLVMGIFHFNSTYLDWQASYYQQLQIQYEIAHNNQIKDNDTFMVLFSNEIPVSVFPYRVNGNAWLITGEKCRMFVIGAGGMASVIGDKDEEQLKYAFIDDYPNKDRDLDGIIFADYETIDRATLLSQKWNELFSTAEFDDWIDQTSEIKYVNLSKKQSDQLAELFECGELDDQTIYKLYHKDY